MSNSLMAKGALLCIGGYQRFVSPYKGYRCAYHASTGRGSCSHYAQQAIARAGVWNGLRLLRRRFERCALAAVAFSESSHAPGDEKFFGRCDPAVREFKKLYCHGCAAEGLESLGD